MGLCVLDDDLLFNSSVVVGELKRGHLLVGGLQLKPQD